MAESRFQADDLRSPLTADLLSRFSAFIATHMGLNFPQERWRHLASTVGAAARDLGFADAAVCIQSLLSSTPTRSQIETLARHLTVGETYFLRDPETFRLLQEHLLPELLGSRRRSGRYLRIWSAGCATGEEPYSVAILLCQMLISGPDWKVTILGTDINPQALRMAAAGIYSEWSFRNAPAWLKEGYFRKRPDGRFEILPRLKEMVTFSYLNLTEDIYPSLANDTNAMDLILCRNVLMYFVPELVSRVAERFYNALTDSGWLLVSPTETSLIPPTSRLAMVRFPEALVHRKQGAGVGSRGPEIGEAEAQRSRSRPSSPAVQLPAAEPRQPGSTLREPRTDSHPPTPDVYAEALALFGQGLYAKTADKLTEQLSRRENDARALALLARTHANQGNFAEAGRWCEKALAVDKLDAGLHYLQALILEEQGAFDAAEKELKRTLYLEPAFALAHFSLGNLSRRQDKAGRAERYFRNALALLDGCAPDEMLPEAEGMTAGRLREIIGTKLGKKGKE